MAIFILLGGPSAFMFSATNDFQDVWNFQKKIFCNKSLSTKYYLESELKVNHKNR